MEPWDDHLTETLGERIAAASDVMITTDRTGLRFSRLLFPECEVVLAGSLPPGTRVAVCEDLGYPSERVAEGTAEHPPVVQSRLFCVVAGY